jgi:hypothetical protein
MHYEFNLVSYLDGKYPTAARRRLRREVVGGLGAAYLRGDSRGGVAVMVLALRAFDYGRRARCSSVEPIKTTHGKES